MPAFELDGSNGIEEGQTSVRGTLEVVAMEPGDR